MSHDGLSANVGTFNVDLVNCPPLLDWQIPWILATSTDSCVVHQQVYPAMLCDNFFNGCFDYRLIGNIECHPLALTNQTFDVLLKRGQTVALLTRRSSNTVSLEPKLR